MMLKLSVILCLLEAAAGYNMCFPSTGCFPIDFPYTGSSQRIFPVLPRDVPVHCYLFTRNNPEHPQEICGNLHDLSSSYFDKTQKTYIIIHSYTQSSREPWMKDMVKAILEDEPANCIQTDWSSGAWDVFMKAIQNARVVGKKISMLVKALQATYEYNPTRIRLIGHGFGAHIAGYTGKETQNIGSIVALAPAAIMFGGEDEQCRLTKNDANFVLVFHTSSKPLQNLGKLFATKDYVEGLLPENYGHIHKPGLGHIEPMGHFNVYVNKGFKMPECPPALLTVKQAGCLISPLFGPMTCSSIGLPKAAECTQIMSNFSTTMEGLREYIYNIFCSHFMSICYYIDSISHPEKYCAQPCQSVEECQKAMTLSLLSEEQPVMGHHVVPPTANQSYYELYYLNATMEPLTA